MPQMYHLAYNSITSTLWYLDKYSLNLTVMTRNKNNKTGEEKFFLSGYDTKTNLVNLYLDVKYFLSIKSLARNLNGEYNSFRIDSTNYYQFTIALNNVAEWFIGKNSVFYRDKDDNIRVKDANKPKIVLVDTFNNKMEFNIGVRTGQINAQQEPGVFVYINQVDEPIFLNASTFMNFKFFMDKFNMYEAAMQLILYLGFPDIIDKPTGSNNHNKASFFDRVGATERK